MSDTLKSLHPVAALLFLLTLLPAGVRAEEGMIKQYYGSKRPERDCNQNGVGDGRDRRMGILEDRNGDGIDDWCQSDSVVVKARRTLGRSRGDSVYVGIEYVKSRGILLKCAAPVNREIAIRAVDGASSTTWQIEPRSKNGGTREILWVPRYPFGAPLRSGNALVEFTLGDSTYFRPVAWDWSSFEKH